MQQVQELSDMAPQQAAEVTAPPRTGLRDTALADDNPAGDRSVGDRPSDMRPDKFQLETRLIELGAALANVQQLFRHLERDVYLFTFGRYDE
jgi:hypothetical protein